MESSINTNESYSLLSKSRLGCVPSSFPSGSLLFSDKISFKSQQHWERGNVLGLDFWHSRLILVQATGGSPSGGHFYGLSSRAVSSVVSSRDGDKSTVIIVTICILKVIEVLTIFKTLKKNKSYAKWKTCVR